jgi:hypothetical protein
MNKGWPFQPLDGDVGTEGSGDGFPPNPCPG